MRIVGCRLREIRLARELSLRAAEEATGLNRGYLSRLESGHMVPLDEWEGKLELVYGPRGEWYEGMAGLVVVTARDVKRTSP